jgi:phospholipid/cholesterol/gamma-HCH transport system ATP-binding protein
VNNEPLSPVPREHPPAQHSRGSVQEPVIRFDDVHYAINGHVVLGGVSFAVRKGRTRVIVGPSGTGKSTILRLLLGLIRPQRGRIFVDDCDITHLKHDDLDAVRQKMGMVFQHGALFDSLTVGENVGFALINIHRRPIEEVEGEVRRLLELVGLDPELIDAMPDQLSGGMQRRVAIARALAGSPEILLYDEPTTGLDPIAVEQITDVLVRLRDKLGITSIVVTHHIPDALKVGDRFLLLNRGRVQFEGPGPHLLASRAEAVVEFLRPFRHMMELASEEFAEAEDLEEVT